MKGFKEFILRGNVIDLAVAVVIGAAFTAIVNAIVTAVFNPAIGALFNAKDLDNALNVVIPTTGGEEATIQFGVVIAAVIQFLLVAAVVYFALIIPINYLKKSSFLKKKEQIAAGVEDPAKEPSQVELLIEIRNLLASGSASSSAISDPKGKHSDVTG
ncbi:large-conductance mechanosensitive channel protein MscL [Conyzicola nivalis]|uniref:Large-conductance mechanosensitive channel n=1 Tax=Conyzicola nivalis TaxID=1477021 RepID=A0A916SRZ5_9MICO|nr:large conductance mechanosensitive channel protein MscL [Conyzicola nivalis]GGB14032.1 large-conductance mechanosensitive channel [Conyzicola nivalis]